MLLLLATPAPLNSMPAIGHSHRCTTHHARLRELMTSVDIWTTNNQRREEAFRLQEESTNEPWLAMSRVARDLEDECFH